MQKKQELGSADIKKLLWQLSLPAFTGMIVMATYNVVDTIFVGHGVGPLGIAGLTIAFPIQMIITAFAMAIGVGGASVVSRSLGADQPERAHIAAGNVLAAAITAGVVVAAVSYSWLDQVLIAFGATEDILPYARDYLELVLLSSPLLSFAMSGNSILRSEGKAKAAMLTMIVASVINLVFDPIFIFGFSWGITGAALATVLSHISAAVFMAWYFLTGRSSLRLKPVHFWMNPPILREIFAVGASSFGRQASGSIVAVILNHTLAAYGGDMAIAAYGILGRILMFTFMPMFGVVQGFQPIAGFNFGAGLYDRVLRSIRLSMFACSAFGLGGFLLLMLFPEYIFKIFTTEQNLIDMTVNATRLVVIALPLVGFQLVGATLFQALGKAVPALILALSRQLLFFIPILLILPTFFGLNGVWLSFPAADILSSLVTFLLLRREWRVFKTASAN